MLYGILRKLTILLMAFFNVISVYSQYQTDTKDTKRLELEALIQFLPEEASGFRITAEDLMMQQVNLNKRDETTLYLLDTAEINSIDGNPYRYTYTYDEEGHKVVTLTKTNQNNQWVNVSFENINYNENFNPELVTTKTWQNDSWVNDSRISYTYQSNNLVEESTEEVWNDDWVFTKRENYNYYPGGATASHLQEVWNGEEWENSLNFIFIRDENEWPLEIIAQQWDGENWQNVSRQIFNYTDAGLNDSTVLMVWDENDWTDFYLVQNIFDENRKLVEVSDYFWIIDEWEPDLKELYTYNGSGLIEVMQEQEWIAEIWENKYQTNYSYNEWGIEQTLLKEIWDEDSWMNYSLINWAFDANGNAIEGLVYYWFNDSWQHIQDATLNVYFDQGQRVEKFVGYSAETAYKSLLVGTLEGSVNNEILVFPNPAKDRFFISFGDLKMRDAKVSYIITDINGRQVASGNVFNSSPSSRELFEISTTMLTNGIYYVTLNYDTIRNTKKLVIMR